LTLIHTGELIYKDLLFFKREGNMSEVKVVEVGREQITCLSETGFCASFLSKFEWRNYHGLVGETVHLLINGTKQGKRIPVKLVAYQPIKEGMILIYTANPVVVVSIK